MLSTRDLLRAPALLRYVPGTARPAPVEIAHALITDARWQLPEPAGGAVLAVIPAAGADLPAGDVAQALTGLVRGGAAGLVLLGGPEAWPVEEIRRSPAAAHLAILTTHETDPAEIRVHFYQRQAATEATQTARLDKAKQLADELERRRAPDAPAQLVTSLAAELGTGCSAVLAPADGAPPPDLPGWCREEFEAVRAGRPAGHVPAPAGTDGPHVLLNPCSAGPPPHQVLIALSDEPWSPHAVMLADHVARHIVEVRRHAAQLNERVTQYQFRQAVLQQVFAGDVEAALRVSSRLPPGGHLGPGPARMFVVSCSPEAREKVVVAAEKVTGGEALISPCPAYTSHVLGAFSETIARSDRAVRALLTGVADLAQVDAVGVSTRAALDSLFDSYGAARNALPAARVDPARLAIRAGGTKMPLLLPPDQRAAWAQQIRARLTAIPADRRRGWVETCRVYVTSGMPAAMALLRETERNVRRFSAAVMATMGLNYRRLPDRAVAQLALTAPEPEGPVSAPAPTLADLLAAPKLPPWATDMLAPLTVEDVRLLAAWLSADAVTVRTARTTGRSRAYIDNRIEAMGAALVMSLTEPGSAPYDVLWALVVCGYLPHPPDPVSQTRP